VVAFVNGGDYAKLKALAAPRQMVLSALCDDLLSRQISNVIDGID